MDKTPKQILANLKEYKYIRTSNRKKFLQAILIDGIAPSTAGTLIGVNSTRESRNPEVIACIEAFKEEANPRQELIELWQAIYDAEGSGVNAAEVDKRSPLPDIRQPNPELEEIDRRYAASKPHAV